MSQCLRYKTKSTFEFRSTFLERSDGRCHHSLVPPFICGDLKNAVPQTDYAIDRRSVRRNRRSVSENRADSRFGGFRCADFGFAHYLISGSGASVLRGSPLYMAPEIITRTHYNEKADLWSVGVILYGELYVARPSLKSARALKGTGHKPDLKIRVASKSELRFTFCRPLELHVNTVICRRKIHII